MALAACGDSDGKGRSRTCGAGTHEVNGQCLPDRPDDGTAPTVALSPAAGTYRELPWVKLEADEAAFIYYTTDGSTPAVGGNGTVRAGSPAWIRDLAGATSVRYFAVDLAGNASEIEEATFVVDASGPEAPAAFAAAVNDGALPSVELGWTNPAADFHHVMLVRFPSLEPVVPAPVAGEDYVEGGAFGDGVIVYAGTAETFSDAAVVGGFSYAYRLFAADAVGNWSAAAATSAALPVTWTAEFALGEMDGEPHPLPATTGTALGLSGSYRFDADNGAMIVNVAIRNDAGRLLFNPKIAVAIDGSATVANADGTIGERSFFHYGPQATAPGATTAEREWLLADVDGPVTLGLELLTHPMLYVTPGTSSLGYEAIDTGTNQHVGGVQGEFDGWFATLLPEQGRIVQSAPYDGRLTFFDLAAFDWERFVVPSKGVADPEATARVGGQALSPDGKRLYVAGSRDNGDQTYTILLYEFDAATGVELRRAEGDTLTIEDNVGAAAVRALAIDPTGTRAWLPIFRAGRLAGFDLATMTAIDLPGDEETELLSLSLGEGFELPAGIAVDPAGAAAWIGFGCASNVSSLLRVDLASFAITEIATETEGCGSGPNLRFGPDGRLFVPRVGYDHVAEGANAISVFDLSADPITETYVVVKSSDDNNDVWDVVFHPAGHTAYAMLSDPGSIFLFDPVTLEAIDADGDEANGHTNVDVEGRYGSGLVITPW